MSHEPLEADDTRGAGQQVFGLPGNVFWLGIVSLFTDMSSEVTIRTLPLFLLNVLGVQTAVIGLIEGVAESTATLMRLASGWFSDHIGQRKVLVTTGYGLSTFVKPLLYFANTWPFVLVIRFLDRVGKGIRTAPRDALITDSAPAGQRGRAFGFHRAMDTTGAVLGLACAAGIAYASQRFLPKLTHQTYHDLVLFAVIPAFISFFVLVGLVREVAPKHAGTTASGEPVPYKMDRNFRRYLLVLVVFTLGNSSDAFLILRAQTLGLSITGIFGLLAFFSLVSALSAYPAGRLSDRLNRKTLITVGWLVYAGVYAGFALATSAAMIWLMYTLYGLYDGLTSGVERALVADLAPAEARGTAFGFYNTAVGIAALPASVIAGIMWERIGPASPFVLGAILALVGVVCLNLFVHERGEVATAA